MKKIIYKLSVFVLGLISLQACTDDDIKYSITMPAEGEFVMTPSSTELILDNNNASTHIAAIFQWDSLTYGISTPVTYTLQFDNADGSFESPLEEAIIVNTYSKSYTDSVFNKMMLNQLNLQEEVEATIKVRLKANLAHENNTVYSNISEIKVTPYALPKTAAFLYMPGLTSWSDYSTKLCSKTNNGTYEGYVEAAQWANFKFTSSPDMNGAVYGSLANSLYSLDASASMWNIWFDAGGYFLVKADLNTMTWSKTAITSMCVTGDFNSWSLTANPMTYDSANKVWTSNCNIANIGYGIQIIVNGDWNFKYGDTDKDGSLVLGGSNIMPPTTGEKTITVNLSNPERYSYTIQ